MSSDDTEAETSQNESTTEHTADPWTAQSVVEDRGGYPAHAAKSEGQGDEGLLRIGFRDGDEEDLTEVEWETFREEFEEKNLALVYSTDDSPVEGDETVTLRERDDVDA